MVKQQVKIDKMFNTAKVFVKILRFYLKVICSRTFPILLEVGKSCPKTAPPSHH